jgi:hypothetical protein
MTRPALSDPLPEHPAVAFARMGPHAMPLRVSNRPLWYGLRASLLLLLVLMVIFIPFGAWVSVPTGGPEPLISFVVMALVLWAGVVVFHTVRSRGLALAADEDGIWLRPDLGRTVSAWLPWHRIESVSVRRFAGLRMLCVKPHDPTYERFFLVQEAGDREVKWGIRIAKAWRQRALKTTLAVPLSTVDLGEAEMVARLREFAGDRCPVG